MLKAMLIAIALSLLAAPGTAHVHVTQKHLVPVCLDGKAVTGGDRRFSLAPGEHTLVATMGNDPRPGMGTGAEAGHARVKFTTKAGQRYEVEVRAPETSYSVREWKKGDWRPVVRSRGKDGGLVSGEPEWTDGRCR
jgi:hypothetical protein